MTVRLRAGAAAAAFALTGLGLASAPAQAATVTISPGDSWSDVLAAAPAGSTVTVKNGTYPAVELLGKDFQGKRLVGESRTGVVVAGLYLYGDKNLTVSNMTSTPTGAYNRGGAFTVTGPSANIVLDRVSAIPRTTSSVGGFDVSRASNGSTPTEVTISSSSYDGQFVTGKAGRGLRVFGGDVAHTQWPSWVTLKNSTLSGSSADLVQVGGGSHVLIENNVLTDPQMTPDDHVDAIQSYGSEYLTITDNTISSPGDPYVGHDQAVIVGIGNPVGTNLTVSNTIVEGNHIDSWRGQGITVAGTTNTVVRENVVTNLAEPGTGLVISDGNYNLPNTGMWVRGNQVNRTQQVGTMSGVTVVS